MYRVFISSRYYIVIETQSPNLLIIEDREKVDTSSNQISYFAGLFHYVNVSNGFSGIHDWSNNGMRLSLCFAFERFHFYKPI